jgi:flagellar motor switch protein FliN/FliY
MTADEMDQDQLAQEWADALSDSEDETDALDDDEMPDLSMGDMGQSDDEALADEWAAALASTEEADIRQEKEDAYLANQSHGADFKDLTQEAKSPRPDSASKRDLDFILDIPLEVSAELGRTKLLINELLQLGQGSVIELNKLAGEPLEIYVNAKLVARGEAVVINEKFGIRLTDIISPIERVKQLG